MLLNWLEIQKWTIWPESADQAGLKNTQNIPSDEIRLYCAYFINIKLTFIMIWSPRKQYYVGFGAFLQKKIKNLILNTPPSDRLENYILGCTKI